MEIIKIGSNAIKLILEREECEDYEFITKDELGDEELLKSLDRLITTVDKSEGISLTKSKLLIQVYPLKNSGCGIYICDTEEESMYKEKGAPGVLKRGNTYTGVYRFDALDTILFACKRLSSVTDEGGAQAYYDENTGSYYLICQNITPKELRFAFINEYAKQLKGSYAHHIREHLRCVCDTNAIKTLSNLI